MGNKEEMFWKLVDEIGWGIKTTDYKNISKLLKVYHSEQYLSSMKKFAIKKRKELAVMMDDYAIEQTGKAYDFWDVSDDGFWDLTAHIVGLGEDMYNFIFKNPKYAKTIKYEENFEYSFNLFTSKKITTLINNDNNPEEK